MALSTPQKKQPSSSYTPAQTQASPAYMPLPRHVPYQPSHIVLSIGSRISRFGVISDAISSSPNPRIVLQHDELHAPGFCDPVMISDVVKAGIDRLQIMSNNMKQGSVITPTFMTDPTKKAIKNACFNCGLTNVSFVDESTVSLLPVGIKSALVINIGWHETTITAIQNFHPVGKVYSSDRAVKPLARILKVALLRHAIWTGPGDISDVVSDRVIDSILTTLCYVPTTSKQQEPDEVEIDDCPDIDSSDTKAIRLESGTLTFPRGILETPVSLLFHSTDSSSLQKLIQTSLSNMPIYSRNILGRSIILSGGGAEIPGLGIRLKLELQELGVSDAAILPSPWSPSNLSYVGACLSVSLGIKSLETYAAPSKGAEID